MTSPMRIGVAGAGLIGRRHVELIEASPDCVLAGIADPSDAARDFARARGIPPARVLVHHAWRLSLKPVAAVAGLACGALLSGSFVVEMVTSWPGLGRLTFDALLHRDLNLVAGCAAAGTLLLGLGLLAADAVIAWADPRITSPGVSTEGRAA